MTFSTHLAVQKRIFSVRYCPLVSLVLCCVSSLCSADTPSSTLTIPLSLPTQTMVDIQEESDTISESFDGQPIDKQADKNWFIAGGLHYTIAEAKQKQDSRQSRCKYYQQLSPQVIALSSKSELYAYRDFIQNEIKFFCGVNPQ
jgi:hypothetical protein